MKDLKMHVNQNTYKLVYRNRFGKLVTKYTGLSYSAALEIIHDEPHLTPVQEEKVTK